MIATASKPAHDVEELLRTDPDYLSDNQRVARQKLNVTEFWTANVNEQLTSKIGGGFAPTIGCVFASNVDPATVTLSNVSGSTCLHHNLKWDWK